MSIKSRRVVRRDRFHQFQPIIRRFIARFEGDVLLISTGLVIISIFVLGLLDESNLERILKFVMGFGLLCVVWLLYLLSARNSLEKTHRNEGLHPPPVSPRVGRTPRGVILLVLFLCLLLLSGMSVELSQEKKRQAEKYLSRFTKEGVEMGMIVVDEPVEYPEYYQTTGATLEAIDAKVQFRVPKYHTLKIGQSCQLSGDLIVPENSEDFNYREFLVRQGIYRIMRVNEYKCEEAMKLPLGLTIKKEIIEQKARLISIMEKNVPEPQASLLAGIVFGQKRVFADEFDSAIKNAGVSHVVAASGYNISFVVSGVSGIFSFLRRRSRIIVELLAVWTYCVMSGLSPSIVRAGLMYSLATGFIFFGRHVPVFHILLLTLAGFMLIDPRIVSDIGFQLSFASTVGLLYLSPQLAKLFKRFGLTSKREGVFLPTLACTLATLPISVSVFKKIPLFSVLVNSIVLPFVDSTLFLGVLALILLPLIPILGKAVFLLLWLQLRFFELVVRYFGGIEWGVIDFATPEGL